MSRIAVKKSRPVAVKKDMQMGYGSQGPVMMFGGGGGSSRPRTRLSQALGLAGGAAGAMLGAVEGKHRSLGGLLGGMQSGAYTGRDIGRFAGGVTGLVPGAKQRLANRAARGKLLEAQRGEKAAETAQMEDHYREALSAARGRDTERWGALQDAGDVEGMQDFRGTPRAWTQRGKRQFLAEQDPDRYGDPEHVAQVAGEKEMQQMKDKHLRQMRARGQAADVFAAEQAGAPSLEELQAAHGREQALISALGVEPENWAGTHEALTQTLQGKPGLAMSGALYPSTQHSGVEAEEAESEALMADPNNRDHDGDYSTFAQGAGGGLTGAPTLTPQTPATPPGVQTNLSDPRFFQPPPPRGANFGDADFGGF